MQLPGCSPEPVGTHGSAHAQAALNLDASVARMGVYGESGEKLWCLSHTEGLHLWEWAAACNEEAAGQAPFLPCHPSHDRRGRPAARVQQAEASVCCLVMLYDSQAYVERTFSEAHGTLWTEANRGTCAAQAGRGRWRMCWASGNAWRRPLRGRPGASTAWPRQTASWAAATSKVVA